MAASIFTLGRKSTTYSAPRYSSVWPFWRPKPFTSVTVMPCTPIAERASRTSSSLKGLMMAVTSFMGVSSGLRSERPGDEADGATPAPVLALEGEVLRVGVGVLVVAAGREAVAEVVGGAQLPYGVIEVAVVEPVLHAAVALVAEDPVEGQLVHDREVHGELEIVGALAVDHAEDLREAVRVLERRRAERDADVDLVGVG